MALLGAKGEVLFQKRTSPFETPKRKAGGVSISPPAPPNDQKGRGVAPPFWIIHPVLLTVWHCCARRFGVLLFSFLLDRYCQ